MMFNWNGTWGVIWSFFWIFALVAYLFALFAVVADLFRDHKTNGWAKALWIIFLVFVPFLTVLVYLIARGPGMQERAANEARRAQDVTDQYIRAVARSHSPTDEIAKAKVLRDEGTISQEEFDAIKARYIGQ